MWRNHGNEYAAAVLCRIGLCYMLSQRAAEAELVLRRAMAIANQWMEPGPLPACYLALLGKLEDTHVQVSARLPVATQAEAQLVLFMATGIGRYLLRGRRVILAIEGRLNKRQRQAFRQGNVYARALTYIEEATEPFSPPAGLAQVMRALSPSRRG